jgi:NADH:ubiquinone oxidoreductase subunit F (NADH-binding)
MTSTTTELVVAAWPDCEPRLLRPSTESSYLPLDDADALMEQVDLSGLLGRGGAAFPLGTKLRTVRDAGRRGSETVVVANGEEGEPASVKDRWLLRHRPHLVLDGLRLATAMVGATRAHV